jgi:hypothetical protein
MKHSGIVENVYDYVGDSLCKQGKATRYTENEQAILHAEEQGGPAATLGVEFAIREPRTERAVLKYVRMPRSRE